MNLLEIGSGKRPHKGFKTIDIEPSNHPDIVGDFRTMKFKDVDAIRAHHILEHFSRDEACVVLSQWWHWLKDGGMLIVETPDFEYICKGFADQDATGKYWFTRHAYGSQEAEWAFHRDGYYQSKFEEMLPRLGFDIKSITRNKSRGILPNIEVVVVKKDFEYINNLR